MWNPAPDCYVYLRCCRRCAESVYFLNLKSQCTRYGQPELNGPRSVASLGLEATYPTSSRATQKRASRQIGIHLNDHTGCGSGGRWYGPPQHLETLKIQGQNHTSTPRFGAVEECRSPFARSC